MAITTPKALFTSNDNRVTWDLIPGNAGSLERGTEQIVDTIFNQAYESHERGLISWSMHATAFMKGQAAYKATIKSAGPTGPIAFTDEATTGSGGTWKIADSTKSMWDRTGTFSFKNNNVAIPSTDIVSIDYLYGYVRFVSSKTGPITMTGRYFPKTDICGSQSFTLHNTAAPLPNTDFCGANANGGYVMTNMGLKSVTLDCTNIYDISRGFFANLVSGQEYMISLAPSGIGEEGLGSVARGYFRLMTDNQSGNVGALEIEALTFMLNAPIAKYGQFNIYWPFGWQHLSSSYLSKSLQDTTFNFSTNKEMDVAYSPYGAEGWIGDCIVTECSMAASMTGMITFTLVYTGDGALTAYTTPPLVPSGHNSVYGWPPSNGGPPTNGGPNGGGGGQPLVDMYGNPLKVNPAVPLVGLPIEEGAQDESIDPAQEAATLDRLLTEELKEENYYENLEYTTRFTDRRYQRTDRRSDRKVA